MMIKSSLKDLMDTLPNDLLELVDNHTSYIEDILLVYSSKYNDPLKEDCWKNFLHQLNRKYDHLDDLFISKPIELHVLYYIVCKNDLAGCVHLLDRYSVEDRWNNFKLLKVSIENNNVRIFKYLYSRLEDITDVWSPKNLFVQACYWYNKEICDFLISKFDWDIIINPPSFITHTDAQAIFRFYIMNQDSKLLDTMLSSFNFNLMMIVMSEFFHRKLTRKHNNYNWIYKIIEHYKDALTNMLYILLDNLHLDIVCDLSVRLSMGNHEDVLLDYYRGKGMQARKIPRIDVLKLYYERGLINQDQVITIFRQILTFGKFGFLDIQTYEWIIDIVPLLDGDVNEIICVLFSKFKSRYNEILLRILKNKELQIDKYHINDLLYMRPTLAHEVIVELLKRGCIVYEDINEFIDFNEDCFIYLDAQLNTEQRYNWIAELIKGKETTDNFFNYILTNYPNLNYQRMLEDMIRTYDTSDDIEEPKCNFFKHTLIIFEKHNIRLSYKRLFNLASQCRHVHLAILLNSKNDD